jgi:hypothetical protein
LLRNVQPSGHTLAGFRAGLSYVILRPGEGGDPPCRIRGEGAAVRTGVRVGARGDCLFFGFKTRRGVLRLKGGLGEGRGCLFVKTRPEGDRGASEEATLQSNKEPAEWVASEDSKLRSASKTATVVCARAAKSITLSLLSSPLFCRLSCHRGLPGRAGPKCRHLAGTRARH